MFPILQSSQLRNWNTFSAMAIFPSKQSIRGKTDYHKLICERRRYHPTGIGIILLIIPQKCLLHLFPQSDTGCQLFQLASVAISNPTL